MYKAFFGLRERPFGLPPDPKFLLAMPRQREALSSLRLGVSSPSGLTLLLGEAGTGKTALIKSIVAESAGDAARGSLVVLSNPLLRREEFYEFLAEEFGFGDRAASSKTRFLYELRAELERRAIGSHRTTLIVDEAQTVPDDLLEEVRLLSNLEADAVPLLNVILVGQPELGLRLNEPHLRQLKQRISLRAELAGLDCPGTAGYVAGRLRLAGGNPTAVFSREAIALVFEASKGVPRLVNVICDNALIAGFAADEKPVARHLVEEVCRDLDVVPSVAPAAETAAGRTLRVVVPESRSTRAAGVGGAGAIGRASRPASGDPRPPMFAASASAPRQRRFGLF